MHAKGKMPVGTTPSGRCGHTSRDPIVLHFIQESSMNRIRAKSIAKEVLIWIPTLFLAWVFTRQGAAKFSDASGWARAFTAWGYPEWFRWTIGFAELLASALLLWKRTAAL